LKESSTSVFPTLATCVKELKLWLETNYFKFNLGKTEVILIGSKSVVCKMDDYLIMPSTTVRNLGVLIDSTLLFNDDIGKVVKTAFFYTYVISLIFDLLLVSMSHTALRHEG